MSRKSALKTKQQAQEMQDQRNRFEAKVGRFMQECRESDTSLYQNLAEMGQDIHGLSVAQKGTEQSLSDLQKAQIRTSRAVEKVCNRVDFAQEHHSRKIELLRKDILEVERRVATFIAVALVVITAVMVLLLA